MAFTNIAKVVQWDNDKGCGFAEANGIKYFLQKSALDVSAQQPKVGDSVVVKSFGSSEKGPTILKGNLSVTSQKTTSSGISSKEADRAARKVEKALVGTLIPASRTRRKSSRTKTRTRRRYSRRSARGMSLLVCVIVAVFVGIKSLVGGGAAPKSVDAPAVPQSVPQSGVPSTGVVQEGAYTTKMEVAKYICQFGHLPNNYVNKNAAKRMYEEATGKTFTAWNFNPLKKLGVMVGGDSYNDREGKLPAGTWNEADVDYSVTRNRGINRLVYSSGCKIYYSNNHYESFSKVEF